MPVRTLGSCFEHICCYGLKNLFRNGKGDGFIGLSVRKAQFPFAKRDVIQCNAADLNGSQSQKVCQMNNGISSDIRRGREFKAAEEPFDLIGLEELGRFSLFKPSRTDKQRSQVFSDDPSLMIQIL